MLIVNTLPQGEAAAVIAALKEKAPQNCEIINTEKMDIRPCIGCNFCWLKTPGICSVKDDYETVLKAYLRHETIIFIGNTAFGAADHKLKNIIDRVLPLVTMYTCFKNGEMRHVLRYRLKFRFAMLYAGEGDRDYLNEWIDRLAVNFCGKSLGAYPLSEAKEAAKCI